MPEIITAHVKINARIFRRFALFNTFRLQKKWKAPALFAAIFLIFAQVCFMLESRAGQAAMIGTVLLLIGIGLPLAYVLSFVLQVRDQAKALGLKALRPVYTLNMGPSELRVLNDMKPEPEARFTWASLHGVYRAEGAYYLYVTPAKAFILPDGQCSLSPAALHDFFAGILPKDKLHGKRPKA